MAGAAANPAGSAVTATGGEEESPGKLTTSRFAKKIGLKTAELLERAVALGFIEAKGEQHALLAKGEQVGVEYIAKSRFGPYFLWPEDLTIDSV